MTFLRLAVSATKLSVPLGFDLGLRSIAISLLTLLTLSSVAAAAQPELSVKRSDQSVVVRMGEVSVAIYRFRDEKIPRPYWAHVKTPSGIQVTRNHPPRPQVDAIDHADLHPGLWLSFGDLNGCDYWRLKARTEHVRFEFEPAVENGKVRFSVRNRYLTSEGNETVCEEVCHYELRTIPDGYVIEMQSEFEPGKKDLVFGDQEEMGLGIRVATPIAVDRKQGGRILDAAGRRNGSEVWGKVAEWCDYSGTIDDQWVGMTMFAHPENFRPSWLHARDYGLVVMNPFGRNAFTKQEPSRIVVKPGEKFQLRFAIAVHETKTEGEYNIASPFQK